MSRTLVAVVILALALNAAAWAAPATGGEVAPKTFEIKVQNAPLAEVIHAAIVSSGAHIAMDGDVTGTITLDQSDFTVDTLLETICSVKGYYWWKDQGGYLISSRPRRTDVHAQAVPSLKQKPEEKTRVAKLQFLNPQFVVYQLGLSDDPGPEEYAPRPAIPRNHAPVLRANRLRRIAWHAYE